MLRSITRVLTPILPNFGESSECRRNKKEKELREAKSIYAALAGVSAEDTEQQGEAEPEMLNLEDLLGSVPSVKEAARPPKILSGRDLEDFRLAVFCVVWPLEGAAAEAAPHHPAAGPQAASSPKSQQHLARTTTRLERFRSNLKRISRRGTVSHGSPGMGSPGAGSAKRGGGEVRAVDESTAALLKFLRHAFNAPESQAAEVLSETVKYGTLEASAIAAASLSASQASKTALVPSATEFSAKAGEFAFRSAETQVSERLQAAAAGLKAEVESRAWSSSSSGRHRGVLTVRVHQCRGLKAKGSGNTSDPFFVATPSASEKAAQIGPVRAGTTDPAWGEDGCVFTFEDDSDEVLLRCWHKEIDGKFLGQVVLQRPPYNHGMQKTWMTLQRRSDRGNISGEVLVSIDKVLFFPPGVEDPPGAPASLVGAYGRLCERLSAFDGSLVTRTTRARSLEASMVLGEVAKRVGVRREVEHMQGLLDLLAAVAGESSPDQTSVSELYALFQKVTDDDLPRQGTAKENEDLVSAMLRCSSLIDRWLRSGALSKSPKGLFRTVLDLQFQIFDLVTDSNDDDNDDEDGVKRKIKAAEFIFARYEDFDAYLKDVVVAWVAAIYAEAHWAQLSPDQQYTPESCTYLCSLCEDAEGDILRMRTGPLRALKVGPVLTDLAARRWFELVEGDISNFAAIAGPTPETFHLIDRARLFLAECGAAAPEAFGPAEQNFFILENFGPSTRQWVLEAGRKVSDLSRKAIDADAATGFQSAADGDTKHSTSVLDTIAAAREAAEFFATLDWPESADAGPMGFRLVGFSRSHLALNLAHGIFSALTGYAEAMRARIEAAASVDAQSGAPQQAQAMDSLLKDFGALLAKPFTALRQQLTRPEVVPYVVGTTEAVLLNNIETLGEYSTLEVVRDPLLAIIKESPVTDAEKRLDLIISAAEDSIAKTHAAGAQLIANAYRPIIGLSVREALGRVDADAFSSVFSHLDAQLQSLLENFYRKSFSKALRAIMTVCFEELEGEALASSKVSLAATVADIVKELRGFFTNPEGEAELLAEGAGSSRRRDFVHVPVKVMDERASELGAVLLASTKTVDELKALVLRPTDKNVIRPDVALRALSGLARRGADKALAAFVRDRRNVISPAPDSEAGAALLRQLHGLAIVGGPAEIADMLAIIKSNQNPLQLLRSSIPDDVLLPHQKGHKFNLVHCATEAGRDKVLEALPQLGFGSDVLRSCITDSTTDDGRDALFLAARNGKAEVLRILLDKWGARPSQTRRFDGWSSIHAAAANGQTECLSLLLNTFEDEDSKRAAVNWGDYPHAGSNWTPILTASGAGHLDAVILLIASGANAGAVRDDGLTALHWAARNGSATMVEFLISAGANANARFTAGGGASPAHEAAAAYFTNPATGYVNPEPKPEHDRVLELLRNNGGHMAAEDDEGCTPLHYAGTAKVVKTLLSFGVKKDHLNRGRITPLEMAVTRGRPQDVIEALKNG